MMTVKGRLLSSTAIDKAFSDRHTSSPEWQAPFPVRISQPYVVVEN